MFKKTVLTSALLLPLIANAQDVFDPTPEEQPVVMAAASSDTVTIDLVVFYQPIYKSRLGGFEALYERVNSLVSDVNEIYSNSKAGVHFEVIELRAVTGIPDDQPYQEETDDDGNVVVKSSNSIFSSRLLNPDGYYDENGNYQDNYPEYLAYTEFGGDIGLYVTDYRDPTREVKLGAASQGGEISSIADEIILSPSTEVVPVTLAHELGHNLEANHEEGANRSSSRFDFAQAFECDQKKTVMWSQITLGLSDKRLSFSSSSSSQDGSICGEGGVADNVQAILQTKVSASERRERPASLGAVSFKEPSYTFGENQEVAEIVLTRTGDLSESSSVLLVADSDTASTVYDLKEVHKRVLFEAGKSEATVDLGLVSDAKNEGTENLSLSLVYPYKANVSGGDASLSIDDDYSGNPGEFQLSESVSVVEGEIATVAISRINGSDGEFVVNVSSDYADSNSATAYDFEKVNQRLVLEMVKQKNH
ncbi:Calx-beta domain-containing protein [Idiomarina sp. HP20-50]|uniref:Calx-beta domain-containing protein n=1 Tax=Idiomarina sp. HP20-50 TaxID=3070813 RepID=UPI00294AC61D|nr:Calx-beta domain-containing protein [Idiomarina sp. HP20-50]MDV6315197.1 Calx-beta domain-containing protein [Idiomarina sp. HP20-50]